MSWKVGDPGARRQDDDVVVESERFNGILGDLRPSQLQLAICRMALKEEALVRVGDEKEHTVWSVVVESFQPVTDCSGEAQDGSVLKKEVKEGDGWDMPTDEFDVSLSVTSAKWLSGAGRALGDVEGLSPAPREVPEVPEGQDPVYPELVHVSTLDPPLRLACRAMKKGEVGHVTASVGSFTKGGSTGVANLKRLSKSVARDTSQVLGWPYCASVVAASASQASTVAAISASVNWNPTGASDGAAPEVVGPSVGDTVGAVGAADGVADGPASWEMPQFVSSHADDRATFSMLQVDGKTQPKFWSKLDAKANIQSIEFARDTSHALTSRLKADLSG